MPMVEVLLHVAVKDFANKLKLNAASKSSYMPQG